MTTTVIIEAHCSKEKEVIVTLSENEATIEELTLQDSQIASRVVFDGREIKVKEVVK